MFTWSVIELGTGIKAASGSAPNESEAVREAKHYAMQYAQDGPVRYVVCHGRKWVLKALVELPETVRV